MSTNTWAEVKKARASKRRIARQGMSHRVHRFEPVQGWNGCHKCGLSADTPCHTLMVGKAS